MAAPHSRAIAYSSEYKLQIASQIFAENSI